MIKVTQQEWNEIADEYSKRHAGRTSSFKSAMMGITDYMSSYKIVKKVDRRKNQLNTLTSNAKAIVEKKLEKKKEPFNIVYVESMPKYYGTTANDSYDFEKIKHRALDYMVRKMMEEDLFEIRKIEYNNSLEFKITLLK